MSVRDTLDDAADLAMTGRRIDTQEVLARAAERKITVARRRHRRPAVVGLLVAAAAATGLGSVWAGAGDRPAPPGTGVRPVPPSDSPSDSPSDPPAFIDEAYRWLVPPPGAGTTAEVTAARAAVDVTPDGIPQIRGFSAEQGPQFTFLIPAQGLVAPPGLATISVTARAVPPPTQEPPDGVLASNVYALEATVEPPGPVELAPGRRIVINLRSDGSTGGALTLERFANGTWTRVTTSRVGTELYAAELSRFGSYALVRMPAGSS